MVQLGGQTWIRYAVWMLIGMMAIFLFERIKGALSSWVTPTLLFSSLLQGYLSILSTECVTASRGSDSWPTTQSSKQSAAKQTRIPLKKRNSELKRAQNFKRVKRDKLRCYSERLALTYNHCLRCLRCCCLSAVFDSTEANGQITC